MRRVFSRSASMLRQILQALRFAISDFFDVPWLGVAALAASILFLVANAYIRTIYGVSSHRMVQWALIAGALLALLAAGNHLKNR